MRKIGALNYNKYRRVVKQNLVGRDFVIGDLHGCTLALEELLNHVRFDKSKDRLFSVGDLVDRGPDSIGALALLNERWFFAVLGNHEHMLRDAITMLLLHGLEASYDIGEIEKRFFGNKIKLHPEYTPSDYAHSGGMWLFDFVQSNRASKEIIAQLETWLRAINKLPIIITVNNEDKNSVFNVVHAEILDGPKTLPVTQKMIEQPDLFSWYEDKELKDTCIWSRNLVLYGRSYAMESPESFQSKDMAITFSGHTPLKERMRFAQQICIDTEAYYGYCNSAVNKTGALTLFQANTKDYWSFNTVTNQITQHIFKEL